MIWPLRRKAWGRHAALRAHSVPLSGDLAGTRQAAFVPSDEGACHEGEPADMSILPIAKPDASVWLVGAAAAEDGSCWIAGALAMRDRKPSQGYLAKVTPDGRLDAEYCVEIPGADTGLRCVTLRPDGTLAVAASLTVKTGASTRHDGAVLLFDTDGTLSGQALLSDFGVANGWFSHIAPFADGDLALTGSAREGSDEIGALALRLGRDLDLCWLQTERPRERGYFLYGHASAVLPDGCVVAIGTAHGGTLAHPRSHGWLARFGSDGNRQWRHWLTAVSPYDDDADRVNGHWIAMLPNGHAVALQNWRDADGERMSGVLIELDDAGATVRRTPLTVAEGVDLYRFRATHANDLFVAGSIEMRCPVLARIDPGGSVLWSAVLDELPDGEVGTIAEAADGAVVIPVAAHKRTVGATAGWLVRLIR